MTRRNRSKATGYTFGELSMLESAHCSGLRQGTINLFLISSLAKCLHFIKKRLLGIDFMTVHHKSITRSLILPRAGQKNKKKKD